jgi:hypothetical protein
MAKISRPRPEAAGVIARTFSMNALTSAELDCLAAMPFAGLSAGVFGSAIVLISYDRPKTRSPLYMAPIPA